MFNSFTVFLWSSKRLFFFCAIIAFLFFYSSSLHKNKNKVNQAELILNEASALLFQNELNPGLMSSDELINKLASKHDAFVYIVNIHGLMLYASTPSTHQFSDISVLDRLTYEPQVDFFQDIDHETKKQFIRCYLPYTSPELPTEKTFLIIDKSFLNLNPYTQSLSAALSSSLLLSLLILVLHSLFISRPISTQLNSIKNGLEDELNEANPNYKGIPELMKIRQQQDLLRKKNRQEHFQLSTEIQYWESFFNSIPAGLIIVNSENTIINANEESFRLFKTATLTKAQGAFLMAAYKNSDLSRLSNEFINSGEEFTENEIQVYREGQESNLNVKLVRVTLNQDEEDGLIIVVNDISRIRQLENTRKEFVANVSHELKTPITVTLGFLEAMEDGLDDAEQVTYFHSIIKRNTLRINNIIQDLLTLSSLELNDKNKNLDFEEKDIASTLRNIIDLTSNEVSKKKLVLECDFDSQIVCANHSLIELAVRNLLENAIRYSSDEGALVKLTFSQAGNNWLIGVSDNGPGIHPNYQEKIFERFFRIDESRDRNTGGSGLGLSIVKHIAQLHQGHIDLDSRLGEGCSFSLNLPKNLKRI
jgi:two-component system, OmpR family, phosphate regulon sensor histidine kinase PhoR